jgi:hypothetical protein
MPPWIIAAFGVVCFLAFVAALGAWLAVELEHQRLVRLNDAENRRLEP